MHGGLPQLCQMAHTRRFAAGENVDSHPLRLAMRLGGLGNVHRADFHRYTTRDVIVEAIVCQPAALQLPRFRRHIISNAQVIVDQFPQRAAWAEESRRETFRDTLALESCASGTSVSAEALGILQHREFNGAFLLGIARMSVDALNRAMRINRLLAERRKRVSGESSNNPLRCGRTLGGKSVHHRKRSDEEIGGRVYGRAARHRTNGTCACRKTGWRCEA
jgi:hypothetical protein